MVDANDSWNIFLNWQRNTVPFHEDVQMHKEAIWSLPPSNHGYPTRNCQTTPFSKYLMPSLLGQWAHMSKDWTKVWRCLKVEQPPEYEGHHRCEAVVMGQSEMALLDFDIKSYFNLKLGWSILANNGSLHEKSFSIMGFYAIRYCKDCQGIPLIDIVSQLHFMELWGFRIGWLNVFNDV